MEATPGQIAQKTKTPRVKGEFIVVNSVDAEKFIRRARIWKLINALIQVKNRTVAHGMDATGVSLAQMNLLDITENIQERNRLNAFIVIVVFQGRTILLYIWKDTRSKEKKYNCRRMNITIWNSSGYLSFRQVWIGINYSRSEPQVTKIYRNPSTRNMWFLCNFILQRVG